MSNTTLKNKILNALNDFKAGKLSISLLKDSVELNGQALENMPYSLIKEIDDIEYMLTISQFSDEEDCEITLEETIIFIESWLNRIPV